MDNGARFFRLACTVTLLALLAGTMPVAAQQSSSPSQSTATLNQSRSDPGGRIDPLPDSPGAVRSSSQDEKMKGEESIARLDQTGAEPEASAESQSAAPQKPVGTAAAEAPNVSAIAGSQPAGVAIAPAKQHRVRTIILRTGAIIGAGVAIGAIVALTAATPSKPPGAH